MIVNERSGQLRHRDVKLSGLGERGVAALPAVVGVENRNSRRQNGRDDQSLKCDRHSESSF